MRSQRMEVAVVGAAVSATISLVLKNLESFSVEEISLIWNSNKDLQKLKKSIVTIWEFLEDAEMKQVSEKPVERWLMKLEAVAFDADYIFDKLHYQLLRKKMERGNKLKKKVRFFFPNSNPILFHRKMAHKIRDINTELKSINLEASELGLQKRVASAHARGDALMYRETDSFSRDPVFVGRENDVAKIVKMVTSNTSTEVSILPIVGMGGLGKTTLTRKVFNDEKIISYFGKNRIWVHVSENNFDPVTILKRVVASSTGDNVDGSREVVLQKLQKSLGDKKYLLVLDNVWNESHDKWSNFITSLKGISSVKGNVIMVTTRSGKVATIVKTLGVDELGVLSNEDCWFIIKAKAFGGESIPSEFETIGSNIAKRCGGLPLAAHVVGSLLCGKSKDEWISIEKNWLSSFEEDGNIVSKILKLSFDNLSSPSLKKCFTLCSIFPKGWWIEKDQMIQLWMAEGYLQTHEETNMEIVGNKVFNLLVQSSLLQIWRRDFYGNAEYFGMHDLVHDLAQSILNPKTLHDIYQDRYISRIDDSSPIPKEYAQCLRALFFNGKASQIIFSNFKCLHSLILIDEGNKEFPVEIGKLICLRYLDISSTKIECLPDSIGHLYHLQTLRATKEYGGRIYLRELPDTLEYLVNLRHLYIPNIKLPPNIGKLTSLQTLQYFQIGDEEGCGITELGSLKNLEGMLDIRNLEKVRNKEEAKSADLFHKPNILKLKLLWNERQQVDSNENVLEGLQPHWNLKSLGIKGLKGSFPQWTFRMEVREELEDRWIRLDNLLELRLSDCKECEEVPMLGHLPRLKSLHLHHLSSVRSLGISFYGIKEDGAINETIVAFPALEELKLIDMENLTTWADVGVWMSSQTQPHEVLVFRRLQYLHINNCRQLMSAPSHFPCLRELEIFKVESGLPLANICGSKLTTLTRLMILEVDELVCLADEFLNKNRDLLELDIEYCKKLTHLVPSLRGGGASLRRLVIYDCLDFKELPKDLHSLNALEELNIWSCPNLKAITYPSGGHLSSRGFTSLRDLQFTYCSGLTNLPCEMLESCAVSLKKLELTGSTSLTNLPQVMTVMPRMSCLTTLRIDDVPQLSDVVVENGSLRSLEELGIGGCSDCGDLISFKATVDRILRELQSLRVLRLYGMEEWDALPDQLQHLTTLDRLHINDFGIEVLGEWLERLSSLKTLELQNCKKLRHLPSKKAMEGLTKLLISDCQLLQQNLEQEATDNSELSKVSHIRHIILEDVQFLPRAQ